jgi:hypothetical protein
MSTNDFRFWVWLFVVVFVFYGDPDVWDKMHDYVMHIETCK